LSFRLGLGFGCGLFCRLLCGFLGSLLVCLLLSALLSRGLLGRCVSLNLGIFSGSVGSGCPSQSDSKTDRFIAERRTPGADAIESAPSPIYGELQREGEPGHRRRSEARLSLKLRTPASRPLL
jgi:hypothetical protein